MVTFTEEGGKLLQEIATGKMTMVVTAESNEKFAEHQQELTVILEKLELLNGPMTVTAGNSMTLIIGNPDNTNGLAVGIQALFETFGVVHTELTDSMKISRSNGFIYDAGSGEPVVFNKILDRYVTNDGSLYSKDKLGNGTGLSTKVMKTLMPDYVRREEEARANANTNIVVGMPVRIKNYAELAAEFGEACCVINDKGDMELVDATGVEPYRFIKGLVYQQMAADVYNDKHAVVETIDYNSGVVLLNIDGETTHNSFMVNGSLVKQIGASVDFSLGMLEALEEA